MNGDEVWPGPFLRLQRWLRDTPGLELRAWAGLAIVVCLLMVWAFKPPGSTGHRTAHDTALRGALPASASASASAAPAVSAAPAEPNVAPAAGTADASSIVDGPPTAATVEPSSTSTPAAYPTGDESSPAFDGTSSAAAADSTDAPLLVAHKAWASREAGTPVSATGVPDGSLPVGNRLAQVDKASFVGLDGNGSTLVLRANPDGDRSLAGPAAVQACAITSPQWADGDAISFDQAPTYDTQGCVVAKQADDGSWRFDLGGLMARAGSNGFALVPAPQAPADFQVAFEPS